MVARTASAGCLWLALAAAALATVAPAHGDARAVADARAAMKAVKYDRAQALLVAALRAGGNTPDELAELLQLAGTTAVVLGQPDVGDQYFRQLLAIAPDATLPAGVAPRLREAFVAAQAAMAALGRLEVRARVTATGAIAVTIVHDPLHQVAAAEAVTAAGAGDPRPIVGGQVELAGGDGAVVRVLDGHGNHVRVIAAVDIEPAAVAPPPPTPGLGAVEPGAAAARPAAFDPAPPPRLRRPMARSWVTWAIPTAAAAGVGLGFTVAAASARAERDRLLGEPGGQFLPAYQAAVETAEDRQLVGNLGFVAAGVIAATGAALVLTWSPPTPLVVAPQVAAGGGGVVVTARW